MRVKKRRVIERWVYRHNQAPGIVVRRTKREDGEKVADRSKYFAYSKHGRAGALEAALRWKRRNLSGSFWW